MAQKNIFDFDSGDYRNIKSEVKKEQKDKTTERGERTGRVKSKYKVVSVDREEAKVWCENDRYKVASIEARNTKEGI